MFMPLKNTAIANAAACPSVTAPLVRPPMKDAMSSSLSARPSRFARMISCGRQQPARPEPERGRRGPCRAHDLVCLGEVRGGIGKCSNAATGLQADGRVEIVDGLQHHPGGGERGADRRLAGRRLDEIGAVANGDLRRGPDDIEVDELARLQDHLQRLAVARVDSVPHGADHRRRAGAVAGEKGSIGQHDIDLVGTFRLCRSSEFHDVVDAVVARREVDDRGDAHPGPGELSGGERDMARPDAHRCNGAMRADGALAQRDHVVSGRLVAEFGEVEQRDGAPGNGAGVVRHGPTLTALPRAGGGRGRRRADSRP
jgi:hypothetical protein